VQNAFAGSLLNSVMDTDLNYQDDVMYIPYVKKAGDGTWTDGGVLRLSTKENSDPTQWAVSTLMDGIGPVTSSVAKLQNNTSRMLWTYFGTGRYYFEQGGNIDDPSNRRRIFGVKEPCFNHTTGLFMPNCTAPVAGLTDVTDVANVQPNPDTATSYNGWFIDLDADLTNGNVPGFIVSDPTVHAERVITDPLAATSGVVFFTTFKPFSDTCTFGGTSSIWAVKYNSGGSAGSLLKGQALIQVSTGSIEQLNLKDAFKDRAPSGNDLGTHTGDRKSVQMQGVPPMQQGLSIIGTPAPVKKVVHIKER
jgi:type IV pilus assembly protein PilY1